MNRPRTSLVLLVCLPWLLVGCDQSNLGRSCRGEPVLVCPPHEWAEIEEVTFEPDGLDIGDVSRFAQIRVVLDRCDDAPALHDVALSAVVPEPGGPADGGSPRVEVFNLETLREGVDGDPVPDDGVLEVEIVNPFGTSVPGNQDITLRFEAVSRAPSGCGSGTVELPYRTGEPP